MANSVPTFYLIAGEASGDRHAAELLRELKKAWPDGVFLGVGGPQLKAAGQRQLFDLAKHAVVGLTDVLLNLRKFRGLFRRVLDDLQRQRPDAIILVDFPGFNLRLAARARALLPDTKIIYYIAPQAWAWKAGRAAKMERLLDLLLVIFPFEQDWFAARAPALNTVWIGHPALDRWRQLPAAPVESRDGQRVVLMPGSRRKEITAHLPLLLDTCRRLAPMVPGVSFQLLVNDADSRALAEDLIRRQRAELLNLEIYSGYQLTHLSQADLALVASGTATLECALANLPMLVLYRANPLTFFIGRRLVTLDAISIVNLIAGKKIVPEFLQGAANPDALATAARRLLVNRELAAKMKTALRAVVQQLGEPGANRRAVAEIGKLFR
ncbi:MAG: lipid-A-disaccharide synthase [Verrucomicrobiales bacterium]|jgi:lipid-A-disaccharide synthase|nr:lipid-A-disaccharide synthase [Verrucomicrobiales bacterium]